MLKLVILFILVVLIFYLLAFVINLLFYNYEHKTFNKKKWLVNREERYLYVKDLIKSKHLMGLTKIEVIDFLGYEFNDMNSNKWTYFIGRTPDFFRIRKRKLLIYFSKENKVIRVSD
ncbi:hypothetical protein [Tenacibaculum holothuriorum]|uniref:hypothetical protein n=1 Tax=Tenacibaculum holothuriorum TaxID=1635173 RepID=UPI000A32957B|nr:hypothetical protein [Tenacibaculum holothuriorum]